MSSGIPNFRLKKICFCFQYFMKKNNTDEHFLAIIYWIDKFEIYWYSTLPTF